MSIQVASPAPSFKTQALVGKEFKTISSSDYAGKWVLLMFYPMDFTFICPTELVGLNDKHGDFADRDCVVIAASTDTGTPSWPSSGDAGRWGASAGCTRRSVRFTRSTTRRPGACSCCAARGAGARACSAAYWRSSAR